MSTDLVSTSDRLLSENMAAIEDAMNEDNVTRGQNKEEKGYSNDDAETNTGHMGSLAEALKLGSGSATMSEAEAEAESSGDGGAGDGSGVPNIEIATIGLGLESADDGAPIKAQDYSNDAVLKDRKQHRTERSMTFTTIPISMYDEQEDFNRTMPFYSNCRDKDFVEHFTLMHKDQGTKEMSNATRRSIIFDLTHGLKRKDGISKTKIKPLGVVVLFMILAIPSFVTNNYIYMIPSLLISFGLIVFCYLFTDWKVLKNVKENLVSENLAIIDELRNKIKHDLRSPTSPRYRSDTDGNDTDGEERFRRPSKHRKKLHEIEKSHSSLAPKAISKDVGKRRSILANAKTRRDIEAAAAADAAAAATAANDDDSKSSNKNDAKNKIDEKNMANATRGSPYDKLTYDAKNYDDFASYLFDFESIDKGDSLNGDEGGVVPRYIPWFLLIGEFFTLFILFLAQCKTYDDGDAQHWLSRCNGSGYLDENYVIDGSCLIKHGASSTIGIFYGYALFVGIFVLRIPTTESQKLKLEVEDTIKYRFPKRALHKMEAIENTSQEATKRFVDYWRSTDDDGEPVGLPLAVIFVATVCLAISLIATVVNDNTMFWDIEENKFLSYFIYGASRLIVSFFIYRLLAECWIINHMFLRDLVAMTSLGGAMYFSHTSDVVCWYEMRSFYTDYQQPIWSGGRGSPPFAVMLIGSLIGGTYAATEVYWGNGLSYLHSDPDGVMVLLIIFLALFFMFRYILTSVSTYRMQTKHIEALKHELLRLEVLKNAWNKKHHIVDNGNINLNVTVNNLDDKEEFRKLMATMFRDIRNPFNDLIRTVKAVIKYLNENDDPPRILGIPMTNAILITGAGYVVTIGASIAGLFSS